MSKTTNSNRPKLELVLNTPVKVKLLKQQPYVGSSAYGDYTLYSVEHEGEERAFFATPESHQALSALALRAGDEVVLKKVAFQDGRKASSRIVVEKVVKPLQSVSVRSPEVPTTRSLDNLKDVMERSLQEAVDITRSVQGVPFQNEDIQKIASCLFIARTKSSYA